MEIAATLGGTQEPHAPSDLIFDYVYSLQLMPSRGSKLLEEMVWPEVESTVEHGRRLCPLARSNSVARISR